MEALRGAPKTVYFNFHYLPFRQARRLPVLVSHRVAFMRFGGYVVVPETAGFASVLLGFGGVGAFDFKRQRSVWQVNGAAVFEGPARLGNGFKLAVRRRRWSSATGSGWACGPRSSRASTWPTEPWSPRAPWWCGRRLSPGCS